MVCIQFNKPNWKKQKVNKDLYLLTPSHGAFPFSDLPCIIEVKSMLCDFCAYFKDKLFIYLHRIIFTHFPKVNITSYTEKVLTYMKWNMKTITWFPSEGTDWCTIHWESTTPIFSWAGYHIEDNTIKNWIQ